VNIAYVLEVPPSRLVVGAARPIVGGGLDVVLEVGERVVEQVEDAGLNSRECTVLVLEWHVAVRLAECLFELVLQHNDSNGRNQRSRSVLSNESASVR